MASTFVASEQELVQSAQTVYAALKAQWETYSNYYWQLGHSFDTIIDYFAFIDGSDAANFSQIHSRATRARSAARAGTTILVGGASRH